MLQASLIHLYARAVQADISAEALAAAREMGREALLRRLAEIGMSEYDSAVYESFLRPVEQEVFVS